MSARAEDQLSVTLLPAATAATPADPGRPIPRLKLALALCLLVLPGCCVVHCQASKAAREAAELVTEDYGRYLQEDNSLSEDSRQTRQGTARALLKLLGRLEAEACD